MAGLPSPANPEQAATDAAARGDLRLFRYEATVATGAQHAVAGFEPCTGRSLDVRSPAPPPARSFEDYDRPDTIELGDIRDRSQPLDNCADCDFPLSTCGRQRLAYAARYNRRILELGGRGRYPSCPMPHQAGR